MFVYEIVKAVQEKFRGLSTRLAERTRKSKVWWGSHGLEPRSLNPDSGGNPSAVDDYFDYCELYEATAPGAGLMLSEMVAAEIRHRFTLTEGEICQRSMRTDTLKEATEALIALDKCDFDEATIAQMKGIYSEVQDMVTNGMSTAGKLLSVIREKELQRASKAVVQKFEVKAA